MTDAYFSPTLKSFIPADWKEDGTYNAESWPSDAVLATKAEAMTYWKQTPPEGQELSVVKGRPAWIDKPALTPEQLTALAEQKKTFLRNEAQTKISLWQTELLLGIITDEDKATLTLWMKYIQALSAVDTSDAPNIVWPTPPE